ncbi:GNAT family N-acetyltransferase [Allopusillimonas ginsengisoli]|nr:GNAT family N-acetyltransferase [Allopusillimonas ginsengisoli]
MLELARINSEPQAGANWSHSEPGGLVVGLARTHHELEALQRFRYEVFTQEMQALFPDARDGLDADRYDTWCEHVMVSELGTGRVVGTYRLLTPENARRAGGYYSEAEFDLGPIDHLREQLFELGRSCTHPDYRNGSVILLLWSGIARLVQQHACRYVLGCASVSLRDGGASAAKVWRQASGPMAEAARAGLPRVAPLHRYPVDCLDEGLPARVPPLIKGYLKVGASICGEPAWDPDFNTADFPVLLDIENLDPRYRRHFGLV